MTGPRAPQDPVPPSLDSTLDKTEAVAAEVQRASDDLAIIHTVLDQELPDEVQVGDVAQAIEHTSQLEKKLADSAETLAQVNAALNEEIERRTELAAEGGEAPAAIDEPKTRGRPRSERAASSED